MQEAGKRKAEGLSNKARLKKHQGGESYEHGLLSDFQNAKVPLLKLGDSGEVFYELALEMIGEIEKNNAVGRRTVFICPVGPVGQYPIFVRLVNERRLSLKNCWFINMDEYLTDDAKDFSVKLSIVNNKNNIMLIIKLFLILEFKLNLFTPIPITINIIPQVKLLNISPNNEKYIFIIFPKIVLSINP